MSKGSKTEALELVQGTLDLLILRSLVGNRRHGYSVMHWIRESAGDDLRLEEGALYPALHRLEERGLVESEWGRSENRRRAKFYRLTTAGARRLDAETSSWRRYVSAVARILEAT